MPEKKVPVLYIVIPCYNEQAVLPITCALFLDKIRSLSDAGKVSADSRVLFVNDGSKDDTWSIIQKLAETDAHYLGVCLSRNRGHQNALLAGLMTAKEKADITISIDCDGQDDIGAMDAMVDEYLAGSDIVYGVRSKRATDTWFKRTTAEGFYKVMHMLGASVVFNHADYRLMSKRALNGLAQFKEVNLFLRGLVPLVGYRCSSVYYERAQRLAGESHYPLKKMLAFAFDGITSLSVKPLRIITNLGILVSLLSVVGILYTLLTKLFGYTVSGWSSMICAVYFLGGVQLLSIGVIGEYVGKIYSETKRRPRFIISDTTDGTPGANDKE
ncbi:MAG: glycosyltransferase family 2 protein [Ruthenibacterium sp.]